MLATLPVSEPSNCSKSYILVEQPFVDIYDLGEVNTPNLGCQRYWGFQDDKRSRSLLSNTYTQDVRSGIPTISEYHEE
jgi:hypothetical protein